MMSKNGFKKGNHLKMLGSDPEKKILIIDSKSKLGLARILLVSFWSGRVTGKRSHSLELVR